VTSTLCQLKVAELKEAILKLDKDADIENKDKPKLSALYIKIQISKSKESETGKRAHWASEIESFVANLHNDLQGPVQGDNVTATATAKNAVVTSDAASAVEGVLKAGDQGLPGESSFIKLDEFDPYCLTESLALDLMKARKLAEQIQTGLRKWYTECALHQDVGSSLLSVKKSPRLEQEVTKIFVVLGPESCGKTIILRLRTGTVTPAFCLRDLPKSKRSFAYEMAAVPDTEYKLFLVACEDRRIGKTMIDPGWCIRSASYDTATMTTRRRTEDMTLSDGEVIKVNVVDFECLVPFAEEEDEKKKEKEKAMELTRPVFEEACKAASPAKVADSSKNTKLAKHILG